MSDIFGGADSTVLTALLHVLQADQEALVRLSPEGRILAITDRASRLLGLEPMQRAGDSLSERGEALLQNALRSGEEQRFTEHFDGKEYDMVVEPTGEGAVLLLKGPAERLGLQQLLALRTTDSLNRVLLALGLLEMENEGREECGEAFAMIRRSSLQMIRMWNHAEWLERTDVPETELRFEQADLSALCRRCAQETMESGEEGQSCQITVHAAEKMKAVFDPRLIEIALFNLLTNAIAAKAAHIDISLARAGSSVSLLVEDDGCGLCADRLSRVYDGWKQPFDRRGYLKARAKGEVIGLGLPVVRTIAEAHDGRLLYMQRQPQGASFRLVFPANLMPEAPGMASPLPESGFTVGEVELSVL